MKAVQSRDEDIDTARFDLLYRPNIEIGFFRQLLLSHVQGGPFSSNIGSKLLKLMRWRGHALLGRKFDLVVNGALGRNLHRETSKAEGTRARR